MLNKEEESEVLAKLKARKTFETKKNKGPKGLKEATPYIIEPKVHSLELKSHGIKLIEDQRYKKNLAFNVKTPVEDERKETEAELKEYTASKISVTVPTPVEIKQEYL